MHENRSFAVSFTLSIGVGKKSDLRHCKHGVVGGWSEYVRNCWDFPTQTLLGFTENGPEERNHPVSDSFMCEKLSDHTLQSKVCRKALFQETGKMLLQSPDLHPKRAPLGTTDYN